MAKLDLISLEGLREACLQIEGLKRSSPETQRWMRELESFLDWVRKADESTRATTEFQERIWDHNPVSSPGQGNISVATAIADADFRTWLARQSVVPAPVSSTDERISWLTAVHGNLVNELSRFHLSKTPHLKIFRVLAALYPESFTTVAHSRRLRELFDRMGGTSTQNSVARHVFVRWRIDAALGSPTADPRELTWRMALPWYLYETLEEEIPTDERVTTLGPVAEAETLRPLPAARRRRGLTAIRGYFNALPSILETVQEGISRADLLDYLRAAFPDYKETSLRSVINTLRGELGLVKQSGDQYRLTAQGQDVLESDDPSELGPWLLTRILGVDHVLKALEERPSSRGELVALLQRVWPGWSSAFAPNSLVSWLVSLNAIEQATTGKMSLTPLGAEWAARIDWQPEFLSEGVEESTSAVAMTSAETASKLRLPSVVDVRNAFGTVDGYPHGTIDNLHLGLWASPIRHFAVLTGISGSGKTQLAKRYAEALTQTRVDLSLSRVHIEPVQPAWYDPAPLFGYVSPLKTSSYVRTGFLNFLLRAASDPSQPYVVILDEMNLSHPEQYFAPILSAMETGGELRFHAEADIFDGVPQTLPYPRNLAIIGTINMDETTHGLSDKVLDRAFVFEFPSIDINRYPGWQRRNVPEATRRQVTTLLTDLHKALAPVRLHFGWRVIDDVVDFVSTAQRELPTENLTSLLDTIVYSKIIPKLRGEDMDRFRQALAAAGDVLAAHGLQRSRGRIQELTDDLADSGTARFWR